ncbi:TetR/AcrR family transcriptional regulator [Bifidobacterium pseudocatenulatum]|uniref:TetR/AcrR family transcriptional regulator n=1 Tax=Bifidobacterium pseudocatenulatum TaxID=28026 RepID=UPI001CFF0774|nr:TetR/AcrR family transcriptional regulator [Bifidobacterium pseudocatenulatum]MCB4884713.1 TetR/AcrR family transcriptional regulator [Bifidobacterium pseudocatenulatum]
MPRPRRDSEILPAKDRLENAFWELLSEREYNKITVTDIVRTADVNRNSFYYHFSGLPELADSAILHAVENTPMPGVPGRDFDPDTEWRKHVTALLRDPEQRQRLDRLALLAGPHSSPELVSSLKEFGRLTMISVLGLDADNLDLKTDLMLDFTVGGMLSVLQRWPKLHEQLPIDTVFNEDVAVLAAGMFMSMSKADMLEYWRRIFSNGFVPGMAATQQQTPSTK